LNLSLPSKQTEQITDKALEQIVSLQSNVYQR